MRLRLKALLPVLLIASLAELTNAADSVSPARGRDIMFYRSLNPANWSLAAYESVWKQWGDSEKPENYQKAFMERYGLHAAPFDNKGKPMGLIEATRFLGKGITNNCLLCHAGTIAGQTIVGLGNATLDLQGLFEDLTRADGVELQLPFQFSYVRGTIDPINPLAFLIQFRDADLSLQKPHPFHYSANVCSDPPAWWLLKKKKTRDWTGPMDVHSTRIDMVNLLTPLNSGEYIRSQEAAFADIEAYLRTIEAPKYPFPIDEKLAFRGRELFVDACARCHGTYGPGGKYPNKIVPLGTIGTDRTLAAGNDAELLRFLNQSWFGQERGPDGKPLQFAEPYGYQAPPLDGVWATAPYFHNGSVPTVYHVLNSTARPRIYTRSYRTGKEDYDPVKLGWKIMVLDTPPAPKTPAFELRKIYDTTQPGRGNSGHVFGDKFSDEDRTAIIEYLKTL
jgi:mono/diheme cytochrome c family protein